MSADIRRPYVCHDCNFTFWERSDLQAHTCTGIDPYIVEVNGHLNNEPPDQLSSDDVDVIRRALNVYDATLMECGEKSRRPYVQRLSERMARVGQNWIAVEDE